jgi:hypothetical protein
VPNSAFYEIVAPPGAGGMEDIYRAPGTKPGLEVALRFLPEILVSDFDRMAHSRRTCLR